MTKIEIIDETVAFYSADPSRRAIKNTTCMYSTGIGPEEKRCAFGRCMTEDAVNQHGDFQGSVHSLAREKAPLDDLLLPQYHGHDGDFWRRLQRLHDYPRYWDIKHSEMLALEIEAMKECYS